nr:PD40 domain-containing protein [Nocardioidaceae bacterium]
MPRNAPLTPETLAYGITVPRDPQISPDGTRIVYAVETVDPETKRRRTRVWLRDLKDGAAQALTPADRSARGARWSSDGTQLAVAVDVDDATAICIIAADPGAESREVTRHAFGVDELAWSPDGTTIAYTTDYDPEDPDERGPEPGPAKVRVTRRIDYKQDGRGWLGDRRSHVFVVDVSTGERARLTTEFVDHSSPQWSPDGRRLALVMGNAEKQGSQLALLDIESRQVAAATAAGGIVESLAWSPTGDRLIYAADPDHSLQPDFFVHEVATGQSRRLTDDLQGELDGHPVWVDEGHVLFHSILA